MEPTVTKDAVNTAGTKEQPEVKATTEMKMGQEDNKPEFKPDEPAQENKELKDAN